MKNKLLLTLNALVFAILVNAQRVKPTDTIEIALNKTTYLHLNGPQKPYQVHVGGIAGNVYYDSVAASNGVIWVKAGKENVPESNMIIAAQDTVLLFVLRYAKEPKTTLWMYDITPVAKRTEPKKQPVIGQSQNALDAKGIKFDNEKVYALKRYMNVSNTTGGVSLSLENIATDSANVYYKFTIENKSKIDFELDAEFFLFKTKSKNNRRAVTAAETNLKFIKDGGNEAIVPVKTTKTFIYKTELTPIRNDEVIVFTILEKSVLTKGRQLTITISPYLFYKMQKI